MAFTPNLPNTGQSLGFTKTPIRDNLAVLRSTIAINHYDVNDPLAGKHKFSVYPRQGTDPATTSTECALYSKLINATTNAVFRSQSSGSVYQMTCVDDTHFASFGTFTNYSPPVVNQNGGWTFLPGGLLFQYGVINVSPGGSFPVAFPVPFSANPYSITLAGTRGSTNSSGVFVVQGSEVFTGFSIFNTSSVSGGIVNCYWQAIGKQ